MFSLQQKRYIAKKVEELLLSFNHPEMPKERPKFTLHVTGTNDWSFAVIEPNWVFDEKDGPGVNPHNERQEVKCTNPDDLYKITSHAEVPGREGQETQE